MRGKWKDLLQKSGGDVGRGSSISNLWGMPWSVSPGYSYWHSPAPWDGEGRESGHSGAGCCPPGVRRLVLPSCVAPVVVTRMKCRMCALTTAWRRTQQGKDGLLLRDVGKWTTVRLGPWRRRGNTAMAVRMLFGHKVEVKRGALYMTLPKDVFNILYAWTHRLPMKTQGNASKYFQGDFYSFPVSLTATPQLPCRKTEQIKGPRFAPCLYGGWDCAVKRDDGCKTVQRARYLAHIALGLLSLHAVKRAVQNPSLTSCQKSVHVRFFVCHEECGTTVPFLLFLSMGMPLSAIKKPRQFEFALLNIHFLSWIHLVLQLHYFISDLLAERARRQRSVGTQLAVLGGRCANDYC